MRTLTMPAERLRPAQPAAEPMAHSPVRWVLVAVVVAQLLPVWAMEYFPAQDGPAHLEGARNLLLWWGGDPTVRHFYEIRAEPLPNYLTHLMLAGLMTFLPPLVAEKVVVSLYAALFAAGALYAVRGIRRDAEAVALLLAPFAFNDLLHAGFYNFSYSLALSLVAFGWYLRRRERFAWRHLPGWMGMGALIYLAHLMPLLLLAVAIGCIGAVDLLLRGRWARRGHWLRAVLPVAGLAPFALLGRRYLDSSAMIGALESEPMGLGELTEHLLGAASLASFDLREAYLGAAVSAFLAALTLRVLWLKIRDRAWTVADGGLLFLLIGLGLYYTRHDQADVELFIPQRLNLILYLGLILWLAGGELGRRWRVAAGSAGVTAALILAGLHAWSYARFQPELDEVTSVAARMQRGRTLLALCYAPHGQGPDGRPLSYKLLPMAHVGGLVAVEGKVVSLSNYEGATPHFPLAYRTELDAIRLMGVEEVLGEQPAPDLAQYARQTGAAGRIDYVLLYGLPPAGRRPPRVAAMIEQLECDYQPIRASCRGRAVLWQRRPAGR